MLKTFRIFFVIFSLFSVESLKGQCTEITAATYVVDFSSTKDTSWSVSSKRTEKGCVDGIAGNTCVKFIIKLNPGSDLVNFTTDQNTSASFYSVNCGQTYSVNTPACITGGSTVCITFCKPGNNTELYTVSASSIIKASDDLILRQNCSGAMSVSGVTAGTVNWKSIFPNAEGTYNNYLSATTGTTSVTVTPTIGAPSFIDYEVSGTGACAGLRRDTIRVYTVSPMTVSINPTNPALCNGASVSLNATVSGGNPPYTYAWNTGSTAAGITASVVGNYSVSVADNTVGCPNEVGNVTIVAAATPSAPTVAPVSICAGNTATLTVTSPVGTQEWFTVASGGTAIATGNSFTTPVLFANTTYYVQANNGCTGSRTAVTVTVNTIPAAPTATGATICAGQTASLNASGGAGDGFKWFDAASGGNLLASTAGYTTAALNTATTFYVQAENNGCIGPRTAVSVNVNSIPANPTIAGTSICSGNTSTLTATAPGGTYEWWDAAIGGTMYGTGISYTTPTLNSTATYYVQTTVNGCSSASRTAVTVTVNPTPTAPNVNNASICGGNTATVSVSSTGDTYRWYNAASGGDLLIIGSSYTSPVLNASVNYYVSATTAAGCVSNRATATITVTAIQNPVFTYPSSTFCKSDPTPPVPNYIAPGVSGTFTGTGALVINATTGEINLTTTPVGSYTVTLSVVSGSCSYSRSVTVNIINNSPDPNFNYASGQFCVNQANATPVFSGSATPGVFSSSPAGLTFQNNSTGEIDFSNTSANTYFITNTITGAGGCVTVSATIQIIVSPPPTVDAGTNKVGCEGQPIALNGTIGGTASSGVWSILGGGQGSFSNSGSLTSSFTPAIGQTFVTLRLTTDDPVGACAAVNDELTIEVKPTPALPSVTIPSVCSGNTATLIATAPGGTYKWFANANDITELQSGTNFTTGVLTSSSTIYISATSADGCTSNKQSIVVPVKPLPSINTSPTGNICSGIAHNYSIGADIPSSSFTWSRAAVVNINNPVISGQTTNTITETLNNITTSAINVVYQIVPSANGCTGSPFNYTLTVKPIPATPSATNSGPVCAGGNIQLSTPNVSGATYLWSGPQAFNSSNREPQILNASSANGGNYSVNIVVDGCTSQAGSVNQIIKAIPAAPTVSNSSPVCVGQDVSLSTPIVLGASYQWTGPNSFVSTLREPAISAAGFANAGNYSLALTVDGCTGPSASTAVVVNPLPSAVPISSTGPVCNAEQLRITADALPAANYYWTGPNGFVSTDREFVIPSMSSSTVGNYQVVVSVAGCPSLANSFDATLKPTPSAPAIDPVSPVCENGTLVLNAALVSGATYNWTGPAGFINNTQSPAITNVTTTMAGNYVVNIVVDGCRSADNSVNVVVNTLPAAPTLSTGGPACVGNALQLNAANISGATYNWSGPAGFIASTQNPLVTNVSLANAGTYTASVTVNGCAGPSATVNAVVNPLPGPVNISSTGPACIADPLTVTADAVPAASYQWSGPNGFSSTDRTFVIPSMSTSTAGTYQLIIAVAGCNGSPNLIDATLKPTPTPPAINPVSPVCENGTLILSAGIVAGATYSWSGPAGFASNAQSPAISSITTAMAGNYAVNIVVNGCRSANNIVNVVVNPLPAAPVLSTGGAVCVGNTLQLNAASITGASYSWTGPAGFVSNLQNPLVTNAALNNAGVYTAAVTVNGCAGPTNSITAIVNPLPGAVNIISSGPACQGRPLQLTADSVVAGVYTWSGPNGFTANTRNISFASMNNLLAGNYQVSAAVAGCPGASNNITTVLKPTPAAPVINTIAPICENGPLLLRLNTVNGAIYNWSGPNGFTSNAQNPFFDSVKLNRSGIYTAFVSVDGCISNNSSVNINVIPEPIAPTISSNSPVCINTQLQFNANAVSGATYRWIGENGYSSTLPNPLINTAALSDSGKYGMAVTVNGCVSDTSYLQVAIDKLAVVDAGRDQVVCANNAMVNLSGTVSGGTTSGIWSTSGTGRFGTRTGSLNNTYTPSSLDTANGFVQLTLTSTNNGSCRAINASIVVQITDAPFVDVGTNKVVCANDQIFPVSALYRNATGVRWTTSGTGSFDASNASSTNYVLSDRDRTSNSIRITATSTGNGTCLAVSDELVVNLAPVPDVDAGKDVLVFENTPYTLNPLITGAIQSFQWSPANFLNNPNLRTPVFRGNADQTLKLTVVSTNGCVATDEIAITVLKPFPIPNVFTPNGDGIHDTWVIPELNKYPDAEVSVFDRAGKRVFYTNGYKTPWDGRYDGKPLPFATYYYIIIPKIIQGVFSGPVTILK